MKNLHENWREEIDEVESKIKMIVDGSDFIMFFKHNDSIYGANENARIVFAKLKDPDDEDGFASRADANFTATNLNKLVDNEKSQKLFTAKDISGIDIITNHESLYDLLA